MKKRIVSMLCGAFACLSVSAQSYTEGDLTVTLVPNYMHDTTMCASQGTMMYQVNIQNSFPGDSMRVVDMGSGYLIYSGVNTTGMNPWNFMVPTPIAAGFMPDNQLAGNLANFYAPFTKVISGPDTIRNINNMFTLFVSDPCHYSNVTGKVYVDNNSDCTFNAGDVALAAIPVGSYELLSSPSVSSTYGTAYSNGAGDYNMQLQHSWMSSYSVYIPSGYQFIFPSTACSPVSYNFTTLPQNNVDFSLQCSTAMDVNCYAGSPGAVRPNIPFYLHPYVNNIGCDSASGQLKLVLDPRVVYNASLSTNLPASIVGDTMIWNYSGLTNLSNGMYWNSFFSGIHLTPDLSVNIGDVLCFRVMTNIPAADVNPANNDYTICLPVVNSYDPNVKEVSPKGTGAQGFIPAATQELEYTVHFQNTGNAAAYNIKVIDTLDANVVPQSLRILGTSHTASPVWLSPGVVQFNFYSIMLPDSTTNEPLSHGFVRFSVQLAPSLAPLTEIKNTAHIYFDFNPAIVTNTTLNTIEMPTGITESAQAGAVTVYPNPFSDNTTFVIEAANAGEAYSFELTDVLGKKVKTLKNLQDKQFTVSRSGLENGIYFYKIYTAGGIVGVGKIIIK